jgi:hypothetical protein
MTMSRAALLALLAFPTPLVAQERSTSAFVVTQDGREVGKTRLTLESTAGAPPGRVKVETSSLAGGRVSAMVSRSTDGRFDTLQMEVEDSAGTELVRAGQRGTRIIVTSTGPRGRRTRELPAGDFVVLLDETLHGLLYLAAELATPSGQPLTGLYVRTGRRVGVTATRRDMGSRGSAVDLSGDISAQLLLDPRGQLLRLDLPNERITLSPLPR